MPPEEFTAALTWLNQFDVFDRSIDDVPNEADERISRFLDALAGMDAGRHAEFLRGLTANQIDNLLIYAWRMGREPFKDEPEFDAVHAAQVHQLLAERLELLSSDYVDRARSSDFDVLEELLTTIDWMAENDEGSRPYSLAPPAMVSFPEGWEERTAAFVELVFASQVETQKEVTDRLSDRQVHRLLGLFSENMIERTDFTGNCRLLVPAARAMALAIYGVPEGQDFTFFLHVLMRSASREHGCDLEAVLVAVAHELPAELDDSSNNVPGLLRTYARQNQSKRGIVKWFRDRFASGM